MNAMTAQRRYQLISTFFQLVHVEMHSIIGIIIIDVLATAVQTADAAIVVLVVIFVVMMVLFMGVFFLSSF